MPAKKNNRKQNNKPKSMKARNTLLPLVSQMPSSMRTLLSSVHNINLTESGAGLGAFNFFRLNSPYDPDASGVGPVAIGYNTWAGLFTGYKVHRVTVRASAFATGGTAAGAAAVVIVAPVAFQAVLPANAATWRTIPFSTVKTIVPMFNGGNNKAQFAKTYDIAKVLRVTKNQYDTDMDFSGTLGSNPPRQAYWVLAFQGIGASSPVSLTTTVELTYEVEWFNPLPMQ